MCRLRVANLQRGMIWLTIGTCITTALLLCYQQRREKNTNHVKHTEPESHSQWTWKCYEGRCERDLATEYMFRQSLFTCNMLCASTQLWPQPTGFISLASEVIHVQVNSFIVKILASPSNDVSQHIFDTFALFKNDLRRLDNRTIDTRKNIRGGHEVFIEFNVGGSKDPRLLLSTDESYKLLIEPTTAIAYQSIRTIVNITANSFCGARHGLETLSQLIWWDPYAESLLMIKFAKIEDAPKFKYRGLLLDTARNFIPVNDLIRTLDAMAAAKLNTFHWHATDSQSFPLKLNNAPQLAEYGSYSQKDVYTTQDIKAIVHHARLRGIRVLIEVDTPGHVGRAWSWGPNAGVGQLAFCVEAKPWRKYCTEPPCGQLNLENQHVYKLLALIYAEIIELTGVDDVFHIGGNEISKTCWTEHLNNTDPMKLWLEFTLNALKSLERANDGKIPELTLMWSSSLTRKPHFGYLRNQSKSKLSVQVTDPIESDVSQPNLMLGFRSVLSNDDAWNLGCGLGTWRKHSGEHCRYNSWQQIYAHQPWLSDVDIGQIEGGEVCQWTDQMDPGGLDTSIWPRALALAERLWTDPSADASGDVYLRMDTQRMRLITRGVRAQPLWPRWCSHNPYDCLNLGEIIEEVNLN